MTWTLDLATDATVRPPRLTAPADTGNKYDRGHAYVISGPAGRTGAARLAARAALRTGAGLVSIVAAPDAMPEHAAQVGAIMLAPRDDALCVIGAKAAAVAIGPATGVGPATAAAVMHLLARAPLPIVLDADALTAFADDPTRLFAMLGSCHVLTPHMGEFARLFPDIARDDHGAAARDAARRSGAVVLLKGAGTAIAAPDGRFAVNRHATPWLATAGAGDVLTGVICGLLAQGVEPFAAAAIGAWLHGDAGRRFGPGLIADDLPDLLPHVLAGCLAG